MPHAFALTADYLGSSITVVDDDEVTVPTFTGGTIYLQGSDDTFDVRAALDAGDGTIVVADDHPELIDALRHYPALKSVTVPDDHPLVVNAYEGQTVAALRDEAQRRDLPIRGNVTKAALVDALLEHDRATNAGQVLTDPAVTPAGLDAGDANDHQEA